MDRQNKEMDIRAMLTFVASHVETIFGSTLVLFLGTSVVLLIRSIGSKDDGSNGHTTVQIDARQKEETIQRALSGHIAAPAGAGHISAHRSASPDVVPNGESYGDAHATPHDPHGSSLTVGLEGEASVQTLMATLKERDAKIEQLSKEVEKLRNTVTTAAATAGASGGDPGINIDDLKAKLEELQGRLAEYEIIEDDIADLSLFKDENARLKIEIEDLRSQLANLATAAPVVVQQAPAPVPESTPAPVAAAAAPAPVAAPELKFEKSDKFELDPNDDIMKEFAAAVQIQQAPAPHVSSSLEPAAAKLPEPASGQEAVDAMFASSMDPQLEVDALLAQAEADAIARGVIPSPRASEPIPEPIAPHPAEAAASAIEAMLANAFEQGGMDADLLPETKPSADEEPMPSIDDLLAEAADTEKMLSEVASIESEFAAASDVNPLEDRLDTDKLLAELALETGGVVPAPATAAAVAPPVVTPPVSIPVSPAASASASATAGPAPAAAATLSSGPHTPVTGTVTASGGGDDLLAEFKDETRKS